MTPAAIIKTFDEAIKAAIPESSLTISDWAATYRFLSPERSARPGKWDNSLVPYLRVPGVDDILRAHRKDGALGQDDPRLCLERPGAQQHRHAARCLSFNQGTRGAAADFLVGGP